MEPCEFCGEEHCICEVEHYDSGSDSWEFYDVADRDPPAAN